MVRAAFLSQPTILVDTLIKVRGSAAMPLASRSSAGSNSDVFSLADVEVLLVDATLDPEALAAALRSHYRTVNVTPHQAIAIQYIQRSSPALIIAGLEPHEGSAVEICREAKSRPHPPAVLVTAVAPDGVPDVLAAGCDGVLLKPFAASLLVNRTSRILRARSAQLRLQSERNRGNAAHLFERIEGLKAGTNREWPSAHCPNCQHQGVTSFDYASMRRAWYACLQCRTVWMAKRLDS